MKYRKKPVVIEAVQFTIENEEEVKKFLSVASIEELSVKQPTIFIKTLEGVMRCDLNDWIIKGIKGEFYPCKPDIFQATYEKAE